MSIILYCLVDTVDTATRLNTWTNFSDKLLLCRVVDVPDQSMMAILSTAQEPLAPLAHPQKKCIRSYPYSMGK